MRYVLPLLIASLLCLAPGLPAAEHTNFVGNWQLDTASTPTIDGKQVKSGTLTIDYRNKMLHLSKTVNFIDGDKFVAMDWKLDHKFHPVTGAGSGEYMAKWESHSVLAAEHEMEGGHESIRLTLSPDGKTLTETIHRKDASGVSDSALVWKR